MNNDQPKTRAELSAEFDSLPIDEQKAIVDDFQWSIIDSGREPSDYWYPLLMDRS